MAIEIEQAELLAQVAHLYFDQGKDQNAIARRLHVSRSSVSRLLSQARREGIVEIRIHDPLPIAQALSNALCEQFGVKEALVLRAGRAELAERRTQVARLAARYLEEHIAPGDVVGISRGGTLHAVVEEFGTLARRNVRVVQLVGILHVARAKEDDGNLARALARKLGGEYYNLTAPLFVKNVETRTALMQEPAIRQVLDLARDAQLAVVVIGALDRQSSTIVRQRLLTTAQLTQLRKSNAVGEICSQYFDCAGQLILREFSERTMALDLNTLRDIPRVIGVATGVHKAKAIRGALRGGFINVLITDDETAQAVLNLEPPQKT